CSKEQPNGHKLLFAHFTLNSVPPRVKSSSANELVSNVLPRRPHKVEPEPIVGCPAAVRMALSFVVETRTEIVRCAWSTEPKSASPTTVSVVLPSYFRTVV